MAAGQRAAIGHVDQDNVRLALGHGIVQGIVAAAGRGAAVDLRIEAGGDPFREQPHRRINHDVEYDILPWSRMRIPFLFTKRHRVLAPFP